MKSILSRNIFSLQTRWLICANVGFSTCSRSVAMRCSAVLSSTTYSNETFGPFLVAYQNLTGRCVVRKHGSHMINIPKADWSSMKNRQLTATPC